MNKEKALELVGHIVNVRWIDHFDFDGRFNSLNETRDIALRGVYMNSIGKADSVTGDYLVLVSSYEFDGKAGGFAILVRDIINAEVIK